MSRWLDRVETLLYDGESVQERIEFGDAAGRGVVVTSHRVLVFTPDADGANYRALDRPNVDEVEQTSDGRTLLVLQGAKAGIVGLVLLVAGTVVSLDDLVGDVSVPSGTSELGLGGLLGLLQTLLTLLALLDEMMLAVGVLALLTGLALAAAYVLTREEVLVLRVAGGADVELPAPADEGIADRVAQAVGPDAAADGSTSDPPSDGGPVA